MESVRFGALLKAFERDPPTDAPRLLGIITGDPERTGEHDLRSRVLVDPEEQAMDGFEAHGTPMAVMTENGRVISPVAAGADAVLELAAAPSAPEFNHAAPGRAVDVAPGAGNHHGSRR